jgi:hypothetical protein
LQTGDLAAEGAQLIGVLITELEPCPQANVKNAPKGALFAVAGGESDHTTGIRGLKYQSDSY